MKIIRPITLTDATLTSSNVPETDFAAWAVGTAYTTGNKCIVIGTTHKIYEALVNVTGGSSPEIDVLAAVPKWLEIGATNRWCAFDGKVGSQTAQATSITFKLTPGAVFDSIAFLNLDATIVRVVLTDPAEGVVYDFTKQLTTTVVTGAGAVIDWYTYFFSSIFLIRDFVLTDIPPYLNAVTDITIGYSGGTAKVGGIVSGLQSNIGATQMRPTIGIHDYSVKEQDAFGVWSVTERAFSKRMSCDLQIPDGSVDDVQNLLAGYRATLIVWMADEEHSSLIVYGFYKDFSIILEYLDYSICNIEIEGLT